MGRRLAVLALVLAGAAWLVAAGLDSAGTGLIGKQSQVYLVSAAGGKVTRLTSTAAGSLSPSWSPDGRRLAFHSGTSIVIATTGGRPLARISSPGGFFDDPPAWSPDGRRLAVTAFDASEFSATVLTAGADGRGRRTVARVRAGTSDDGRGPVWSPDGRRLAFAVQGPGIADQGGVSASGELDLVASAADGSKRLTLTTAPGSEFAPSWSPDRKSILYEGTAPNTPGPNGAWLRLVPAAGGPSTTIVRLGEAGGAAWSPDGRWIAFVAWLPRESRARLYVVRPNGAGLRRLTGEVLPRTPAWSPDGTTIAYAAYGGTIETIRPDGSGHTTVASLPGAEIDSLAWSPTGKTIAFDARKTPPES